MAEESFIKTLQQVALRGVPRAVARARQNFVSMVQSLTGDGNIRDKDIFTKAYVDHGAGLRRANASFNSYAQQNKDRLTNRLGPRHLGRMVMFMYDPKYKETLPYYDRLPLILPIEFLPNGRMLGLNLHYLPPKMRAALLDELMQSAIKPAMQDEKKRIRFSYATLKKVSNNRAYAPCIKKYIVSSKHVKSKFLVVPPNEWAETLFLPYERFEKASNQTVWRDSGRQIRKRN